MYLTRTGEQLVSVNCPDVYEWKCRSLRNSPSLCVLLAGEEKVFVLDPDVPVVGGGSGLVDLAVVVLVDELLQVEVELFHAVGRDEDLEPGIAAGERLRDLEEASPGVLLEIDVVLFVLFEHDLRPQLPLLEATGINRTEVLVELNHGDQVLAKLCRSRQSHQDLTKDN